MMIYLSSKLNKETMIGRVRLDGTGEIWVLPVCSMEQYAKTTEDWQNLYGPGGQKRGQLVQVLTELGVEPGRICFYNCFKPLSSEIRDDIIHSSAVVLPGGQWRLG